MKEPRHPPKYWLDEDNQRVFLEGIAKELNITKPEDWGRVTFQQVIDKGGKRIIDTHSSLFKALRTLYPSN